MNPLKQSEKNRLGKLGLNDLERKIDEIVDHLNDNDIDDIVMEKELYFEDMIKDKVSKMLFSCYPDDMENFDTMTKDQAYRLIKKFWEMLK